MSGSGGGWLGAAAGAVGWTLTLATLARGGGYLQIVPGLSLALPLAVAGTVTALAAWGVGRRTMSGLHWLLVVVLFALFWNFIIHWLHHGPATWALLLPLAEPTGLDFRDGLYQPAREFSTVHSAWPPLTLLLGRLFTLVDFETGRAIQVTALVLFALASTGLSALLATRAVAGAPEACGAARESGDESGRDLRPVLVGLVSGVWLLTSSGFMLELERGNINLYALFFSLVAVWLMLRPERSPWWPALALAVAINLKLYPGVLVVLLLWRYRLRALVPLLVTNGVLLLSAGPANVVHTITGQGTLHEADTGLWWMNHSAASLSFVLEQIHAWPRPLMTAILMGTTLVLWSLTMVPLVRRGWSTTRAVLAAAACVPVMCVVPAISHDYKLVLFVLPVAVLIAFVPLLELPRRPAWAVAFGLTAWVLMELGRSSLLVEPALLSSKYALIVLVQALLLYVVWRTGRAPAALAPAAEAVSERRRDDGVTASPPDRLRVTAGAGPQRPWYPCARD